MADTPYQNLEIVAAEIKRQAEAGEWEIAAQIATRLSTQIEAAGIPPATQQDRAAIEAALASIAAITERAEPLRDDIARLLKAFG